MRHAIAIVLYIVTFVPAAIYGFRALKIRREMEDTLDWGKVGPGVFGKSLRNVPRQYATEHPDAQISVRYALNLRLSLALAVAFVLEVIILQR